MRKLLTWIILLPVAVAVIAFAVANRAPVPVSLDPLPVVLPTVPLYAVAMTAILLGLLVGGFAAWVGAHKWRRLARQKQREADRLADELKTLQQSGPVPGRSVMTAAGGRQP